MAQAFNFETRELIPYREDWNRGGNVKISGALWYIQEKDGLYLIDKKGPLTGMQHIMSDYCVAQGLPAALLSQGDALVSSDFDFDACYQAYFKIAEKLFPKKPAYNIPIILDDWEYTLYQSFPINHNISGYIDNFAITTVGLYLRKISNPFRSNSLDEIINYNYYYTCNFANKDKPQLLFGQVPAVVDRTEAPLVFANGIDQPRSKAILQADGFIAAIINMAFFYHWQKTWSRYNFIDIKTIQHINKAYQKQEPIIEIKSLHELSFNLPVEVEKLCQAYMNAFMPIMQKVWQLKPTVQFECIEGDYIYTYIYAHEAQSPDRLYASELYANLTYDQKCTLVSYNKRFMDWLIKNYPITPKTQFHVMQAMAKDMPPIQLTINTQVTHTHASETENKPRRNSTRISEKFCYIISDNKREIAKIHKRIELHLASPAKLRDELARLQEEKLVSLPMDKPTAIINAIRRVWGDQAPKVRSFVTTWGRRF